MTYTYTVARASTLLKAYAVNISFTCWMAEVQILLAFGELGFSSVKPEQMNVVKGILRRDVFAILPTGFGKSACFQCLPILLDKMFPDDGPSITLVVTPLTAIIKYQVSAS